MYVFIVMRHDRRKIVHFNVTTNPHAVWAGQQIVNAFPWETSPRFLIRDNDGIYGSDFTERVESLGIEEVPIAPYSPWQNPYCARVIGSIRRECLNHVIVLNERHLKRILADYFGLLPQSERVSPWIATRRYRARSSFHRTATSSRSRWLVASIIGTRGVLRDDRFDFSFALLWRAQALCACSRNRL